MSIQRSHYGPVHIPNNVSYPDTILQRIHQRREHVAMIDETNGNETTYEQFGRQIRSFASTVYNRGVRKGEVVMVFSPNHVLYPVTVLGMGYVGAITTTVNPNYTPEELQYFIDDSQPTYIFTMSFLATKVKEACVGYKHLKGIIVFDEAPVGCTSFKTFIQSGDPTFISPVRINPKEDVVVLPYSSGTTGRSKGVMLTHYNIVANIYQSLHPSLAIGPLPHETFVCFLPFYHIYAMTIQQAVGFTRGDTLIVIQNYDEERYLKCIQKYKATFLHVVPPVALQLSKNTVAHKYDLSSVQTIYCGAAPLGPEVEKEVLRSTGIPTFRQGYGLTETSPNITVAPVNGSKHGAAGMLIPNTECKIVEVDTQEVLGTNKDGELWIRGPQVMKGYWKHPGATANAIDSDGFFHTGDIGHYDEDGHFYVVDRLKELIKWKGLQVAPADLEFVLLKHPAIDDVAVVGIPDDEAGEVPKAYVVLKPGIFANGQEIVKFVAERVSPHKRLRGGVEFVAKIPKSPSGKTLRRLLRKTAREHAVKSKL